MVELEKKATDERAREREQAEDAAKLEGGLLLRALDLRIDDQFRPLLRQERLLFCAALLGAPFADADARLSLRSLARSSDRAVDRTLLALILNPESTAVRLQLEGEEERRGRKEKRDGEEERRREKRERRGREERRKEKGERTGREERRKEKREREAGQKGERRKEKREGGKKGERGKEKREGGKKGERRTENG